MTDQFQPYFWIIKIIRIFISTFIIKKNFLNKFFTMQKHLLKMTFFLNSILNIKNKDGIFSFLLLR